MAEQASPDHLAPPTVSAGRIVLLAIGGLIFLAVTFVVLAAVYFSAVPRTPSPPKTFPTPRLRADPDGELKRLMAEQRRQLSGYHWANPEHTLMSIPIERAMDLITQRGADAFAPIVPAQAPPQPGDRP